MSHRAALDITPDLSVRIGAPTPLTKDDAAAAVERLYIELEGLTLPLSREELFALELLHSRRLECARAKQVAA